MSGHFSSIFSSYYIYIRSFSKNAFFFFCERAAVGRKTHPFIVTRAKTKKRIFLRGKKMRFLRRAHAQGVRGERAYAAKGFGCLSRHAHAQGVRRIGAVSRQNEETRLLDPSADGRCPAEHPIRPRGRGGAAIRTPPLQSPLHLTGAARIRVRAGAFFA